MLGWITPIQLASATHLAEVALGRECRRGSFSRVPRWPSFMMHLSPVRGLKGGQQGVLCGVVSGVCKGSAGGLIGVPLQVKL